MQISYRPIDRWPGEQTRNRKASPFQASWDTTLDQLHHELRCLNAKDVVFQVAFREDDFRKTDGQPKTNARAAHPGVILAFDSKYGPLKYATDTFTDFQSNVRAITLGLEALRKVDRYGITKRGEQYTGWKALPSAAASLVARGQRLIEEHGGVTAALKATHPDHGGDPDDFHAVQSARQESDPR